MWSESGNRAVDHLPEDFGVVLAKTSGVDRIAYVGRDKDTISGYGKPLKPLMGQYSSYRRVRKWTTVVRTPHRSDHAI